MREREPLMVQLRRKHPMVVERKQGQQQIERVEDRRLHLPGKAVPPKGVRVPRGSVPRLIFATQKLNHEVPLINGLLLRQKRELFGQQNLPVEHDGRQQKAENRGDGGPFCHLVAAQASARCRGLETADWLTGRLRAEDASWLLIRVLSPASRRIQCHPLDGPSHTPLLVAPRLAAMLRRP